MAEASMALYAMAARRVARMLARRLRDGALGSGDGGTSGEAVDRVGSAREPRGGQLQPLLGGRLDGCRIDRDTAA